MQNNFENTGFARLYLWTTKAKYTMGIFFVVFVLVYLLFGLLYDGVATALDFFTAVQMMFAGFFIGIAQQAIVPTDKLSKTRCVLWVAAGLIITLAFSLVFGWFSAFPLWCAIVFFLVLAVGMLAMLLGYYLDLRRETRMLNQQLDKFKSMPAQG